MSAPRWVVGMVSGALVAVAGLVVTAPGSASADDTRFNLEARGDAFYFEINGDEIPVSPNNDAGSLTAAATTTSAGGSKGFAGMPYWGNTLQHAPGTVNGVPNQFGAGAVQLPLAVLPGYVATSSNGTPDAEEDFGVGRVSSSSRADGATSSASYGAPAALAPPNQQQSANATTESKSGTVVAVASGSSAGFVSGPLEVANSTAVAAITQTAGHAAKIESKTFGRFAVNGQEFGFDQSGFRYLGQGVSSQDALDQANAALKDAGIRIDLAPVTTAKDAAGKVTYAIGGLMVSTTQPSPTGAGTFTIRYVLGRAQVGAVVAKLGDSGVTGAADTGAPAGTPADARSTSGLEGALLPSDLGVEAAGVPVTASTVAADGSLAPTGGSVDLVPAPASPRTLGSISAVAQTGHHSEWLYAALALSGIAVVGGGLFFSRFARTS